MTFLTQIYPKIDLWLEIGKINVTIRISILTILCMSTFRQNRQLWRFCPKMDLVLEIQKTNVWIRMIILKILCVPNFLQNGQLSFFWPKFAEKWIWGSEFQKSKCGFGISTFKIPCVLIFREKKQPWIFPPIFSEIAQLHVIFLF